MFQAHGQDPLVDLVKLHQLQQVDEQRQAVIHGVVLPAAVFALPATKTSESAGWRLDVKGKGAGTYGDDEVVFGLELVA